jgi:hypothetical protein
VFQILPSTAANPGFGLTGPLDGNNPYDAGAYLNALLTGPANGSLATAFAMYQGGPGNPTPYGSNTPVSAFLSSLGSGSATTSATLDPGSGLSSDANTSGMMPGEPGYGQGPVVNNAPTNTQSLAASPTQASSYTGLFSSLQSWLASESASIGFILVGIIILIGAFLLFAKDTVQEVTP